MPRKFRFIVIPISILALLLLLFLITTLKPTLKRSQKHPFYHHLHVQNHLQLAQSHCDGTLYRDLCISTVSTMPDLHNKSLAEVLRYTIRATEATVKASVANVSGLESGNRHNLSRLQDHAVKDCLELLNESSDELQTVLGEMAGQCGPARNLTNMLTFLSGVMTNQYTCLDGFADSSDTKSMALRRPIEAGLYNISRHVSNSLAMLKKIRGPSHCMDQSARSSSSSYNDLAAANSMDWAGFPGWMTRKDRRLLQAAVAPGDGSGTKADLVVAKDDSGDFTTVGEAVEAAPNGSRRRFVIYIKEGAYFENVEVGKKKTNIMFIGDGIGKTIIKANRNVADGYTTFRSATVAVVGAGFIAKGITVENYAGPTKHQAVALRSDSDFSAFYHCSFIAYQDTLYTHSLRQFYRECDVYGTVDFIFGNAAVVFQNCNLYAREPLPKQKNMFTAQGRKDPNQNTGISVLNCKIAAAADLAANQTAYKTFLGRPWKEYSRTVFMLSDIHDLVDPAGWLEWSGEFALDTLYYGEYMNTGPGAGTAQRVTWPGFRVINSSTEASAFTVRNFIEGDEWLPSYDIPFFPNLSD